MATHANSTAAPAVSTGANVDKSTLMNAAWAWYRTARLGRWAAGDESGKRRFLPALFANSLRRAWEDARKAQRHAANVEADRLANQLVAKIRESRVDLAKRMEPDARSARLSTVRDELTTLDYAPWGVRTSQRRSDLAAELSILEHAAA